MATWYRLTRWGSKMIERVEVIKETAEQVVYKERQWAVWGTETYCDRRARKGGEFFMTFDEAKTYKLAELGRKLQNARDEVSRVAGKIAELNRLTEDQIDAL